MTKIPCEVVLPIVKEYISRQEIFDDTKYETNMRARASAYGEQGCITPETSLAFRAGFATYGSFWNFYSGQQLTLRFEQVDALLCAMGQWYRWYEEPLSDYYWEGKERPPDLAKPIKCQNPACPIWFSLEANDEDDHAATSSWHKKCCSRACNRQLSRFRTGKIKHSYDYTCDQCGADFVWPRRLKKGVKALCSDECRRAAKNARYATPEYREYMKDYMRRVREAA